MWGKGRIVVAGVISAVSTGVLVVSIAVAGDNTPPTSTMTAPTPGTVSGAAVTVSADATDNASVAGVQFKLDGANLGAEDTAAPYSISWDSTTVSDGSYTLTAVARDSANNQTTSSGVGVTVDNGADPTANLWVDTNGGTCTRQATPAVYADASACSTFQAAYVAASLGDTVRVRSGTYPAQTMNYISGKATEIDEADVAIIADGAVTVDSVTGYGVRHVRLDDFTFSGGVWFQCETADVPAGAEGRHPVDVTVQNSTLSWTRSENASLMTISNNSIGPSSTIVKIGASGDTAGANCTDEPPEQIVFEGNDIHEFREASSAAHMECVFVEGVQGITFRRNIFRACSVFDLFFKQQGAAGAFGMSDITIENNMLGHPVASAFRTAQPTALSFSGGATTNYANLTVRHNSINAQVMVRSDQGVTFTNALVEGNLMEKQTVGDGTSYCSVSGLTVRYNGYMNAGEACAADIGDGQTMSWTDVETTEELASTTAVPTIDYHLSSDAAWAVNKITATTSTEDYDQQTRPIGASRDIGCDERA